MGCGQSKINLYPRRNKNGGKGNSAKKSEDSKGGEVKTEETVERIRRAHLNDLGKIVPFLILGGLYLTTGPYVFVAKGAADKEADEEEGNAGSGLADDTEEEDNTKHILPLNAQPNTVEVSASMQDFFKMLDEKIEKGKDYDSSSETEVQIEKERRRKLIDQWRSASQSTQSSCSQSSPNTPARRRMQRPAPHAPDRQNSPGAVRRCYRQQHVPEGMSPPTHRAHSAQSHHPPDVRPTNGDWQDPTKSPVKRPQSAGANWKSNPKVAPYNQKPKKNEANENQRAIQKEDGNQSDSDASQITYNPTFQTHSPAHTAKQPYIAQIVSYPMSQQVTPPSPPKFIAPPEEYQDPHNNVVDNKYTQKQSPGSTGSQSHIYYIHGNTNAAPDLATQRQQTALHLQQYVAMKQAQQHMFTYLQRGPHTVFPNVDYSQVGTRMYEGEEYAQYHHPAMRPHTAPTPVGVVRPMPVAPGFGPMADGSHMVQMPMWPHVPPVVSTMGPWVPHGQEMQYYPQSQFVPMYRAHSAGSAGTLTRYHKKDADGEIKNVCQSINLVRQKQIGQIVSAPGQELSVCNSASDTSSTATMSSESGTSPGAIPKNTFSQEPYAPTDKVKKKGPFGTRSLKNSKSLDS